MVIEITRHGIRGPTSAEFDPYWSDKIGILLPEGRKQMYQLGQSVAADYPHLFTEYNSQEVYVRSLNISRTMETAQAHLNGIFPGMNDNWKLPEIQTVDVTEDYLMYSFNSKVCPNAANMKKAQLKTEVYQNFEKKMRSTMKKLFKTTGLELEMHKVSQLQNTLWIDYLVNRDFPKSFKNIKYDSQLWKNLTFVHDFYEFFVDFGSHKQSRLYSFMMFEEILDHFNARINETNTKLKFAYYSGTDTLLMPILHSLNVSSPECLYSKFFNESSNTDEDTCLYPNFGSNIIFELHSDGSEYYVLMKYNDMEVNLGCSEHGDLYCSFEEFRGILLKAIGGMTHEKYSEECQLQKKHKMLESGGFSSWLMLVAFIGFVVTVIMMLEIVVYMKRGKGEDENLPIIKTESQADSIRNE